MSYGKQITLVKFADGKFGVRRDVMRTEYRAFRKNLEVFDKHEFYGWNPSRETVGAGHWWSAREHVETYGHMPESAAREAFRFFGTPFDLGDVIETGVYHS